MVVIAPSSAQARRAQEVDNALASVRLEGLEPPEEAKALFQRYIAGELTSGELDAAFEAYFDREYLPVRIPGN